jgi:hypothetical protein
MPDTALESTAAADDTAAPSDPAAAATAAAAKSEATPTPPKGADFDTVAAMHSALVTQNHPAAAAFHKKHVLGFKTK